MKPEEKGVAEQDGIDGAAISAAWRVWLSSEEGQACMRSLHTSEGGSRYLRNRLERAFIAGASVSLGTTTQISEIKEPDVSAGRPPKQKELAIGDVWWDEHHKWTDGGNTTEINLILSADMEDDLYLYRCARFMWCGLAYCGASDRKFLEREVRELTYVGNIREVWNFIGGTAGKAPSVSDAPESVNASVIPESPCLSTAEIAGNKLNQIAWQCASELWDGLEIRSTASMTIGEVQSVIGNALACATEKLEAEIKRLKGEQVGPTQPEDCTP